MKLLSSQAREQIQTANGPWALYSEKVSDGSLNKDNHQETVVQQLQELYEEVKMFERPIDTSNTSSLFRFFKKQEPHKIIAPKGLYIYGSVGGGKTMLMDLFYESVPVSMKYFNTFYNRMDYWTKIFAIMDG